MKRAMQKSPMKIQTAPARRSALGKQTPMRQRCELTTDPEKRKAVDAMADSVRLGLPQGLARPALRALAAAGITNLDQLAKAGETKLAALHGMGKKGIETIRRALEAAGKRLRA